MKAKKKKSGAAYVTVELLKQVGFTRYRNFEGELWVAPQGLGEIAYREEDLKTYPTTIKEFFRMITACAYMAGARAMQKRIDDPLRDFILPLGLRNPKDKDKS